MSSEPKIIIVDEKDRILGYSSKIQAAKESAIRRVVRIFVFDKTRGMLMQQRSASRPAFALHWDCGAAGHVDEGESYEQAAVRESEEEIGLRIKEHQLTPLHHFYEENDSSYLGVKYRHKTWCRSFAVIASGPFKIDQEEVAQVKWMEFAEVKQWYSKSRDDFIPGFNNAFEKFLEEFPTGYPN